jgi:hypothetical protein
VDSNPSPPSWRQNWGLVAEETGGGAEILRECGFRSQDNNYPGRELGRGLILNFAGRVLVEGRGAGRRKKGGKPVSRELQGRVPGAGRNGTSKVATKCQDPRAMGAGWDVWP